MLDAATAAAAAASSVGDGANVGRQQLCRTTAGIGVCSLRTSFAVIIMPPPQ